MRFTRTCLAFIVLTSAALIGFPVSAIAQQEQPKSEDASSRYGADRRITFKKNETRDLQLYLFFPGNSDDRKQPRPAIVFFFGGGWVSGSPKQFQPHAEYFRSRGMVAILADYRTGKSHGTSPAECVADAKSAVRFLRTQAKELGIDPARIVASGGSAGGHLAAATATLKKYDEPDEDASVSSRPTALVLFNPVYDNGPDQWGHNKVKDEWQQISPAANIRKGMPPAIVFLGSEDKLISVETARAFQARMKAVGSQSELHIYPNEGHGFFNFGRGKNKAFIDTVTKTDVFLTRLGYLSGTPTVESFVRGYGKK